MCGSAPWRYPSKWRGNLRRCARDARAHGGMRLWRPGGLFCWVHQGWESCADYGASPGVVQPMSGPATLSLSLVDAVVSPSLIPAQDDPASTA